MPTCLGGTTATDALAAEPETAPLLTATHVAEEEDAEKAETTQGRTRPEWSCMSYLNPFNVPGVRERV